MAMTWIGAGVVGKRDGRSFSIPVRRRSMTGAKPRPPILSVLLWRNNGPSSIIGPSIMAFSAAWESEASFFSITFCVTLWRFYRVSVTLGECQESDVRKQVSGACLRELLFGSVPQKA